MARQSRKPGKKPAAKAISPEEKIEWLTAGEYALHRSVSVQTIYKYLQRGKLPVAIHNSQKVIDKNKADKILDSYIKSADHAALDEQELAGVTPQETYAGNRAKRERFEMELKRVAYEQKIGKLIDKAAVERAAYEVARVTRDTLLAIPDRISAEVAAETDVQKVHFLITEALLAALNHGLNDPLKGIKTLEGDGSEEQEERESESAIAHA